MNHTQDRGAALVEMVVVVHLLVLLLVGVVCFGVLLGYQQTLIRATSDAARVVAVTASPDEQVERAIAAIDRGIAGARSCADESITCEVTAVAPCTNDPTSLCRTIRVEHDHLVEPVVPRLPVIAMVLPEVSRAEVTVVVSGGQQ